MKYNDNGEVKELNLKVMDTLPIGSIVEYSGDTVPDGWVKNEATDDYSAEEVYTGKHWIDGKKIYSQVFIFQLNGTYTEDNKKFTWYDPSISFGSIISVGGYTSLSNGYKYPISSNGGTVDCVIDQKNRIQVGITSSLQVGQWIWVILEYTKTTD